MKHFTRTDIDELARIPRANLINSISGYKPANLIGTVSRSGNTNLAIFSSVVHLGADPPLLGFVQRPASGVDRHTCQNIRETGVYTINHVNTDIVEQAHYTSAKFDRDVSEFEACGLTEEYLAGFAAPFVKESRVKIGLRLVDEMPIERNGTIFIIGEVEHIFLPDEIISEEGNVDLNAVETACISGLDTYHSVRQVARLPYARPFEVPDFDR